MSTPYAISQAALDALGFDLNAGITAYQAAKRAHATKVDAPAPSAHPVVEMIVNSHQGKWVIGDTPVPVPTVPVPLAVSPMQFWVGAASVGFITMAEAEAAAKREALPAVIEAIIATFPTEDDKRRARVVAFTALEYQRDSDLIDLAVAGINAARAAATPPVAALTSAGVDDFFRTCAAIVG